MSPETHSQLANFTWSICNLLRGPYKRNEYRKVLGEFAEAHGATLYRDRKVFLTDLREIDRAAGVRLTAPELKAILNALGERDDTAEMCRDRNGEPEPDPELRDTESVPLKESITSEEMQDGGDYPVFGGNGVRGFTTAFTHRGHYVLIGRQGALCGNVNYASGEFWASEHAVVVSPLEKWSTIWMGELLGAMNLNQYSQSAAQPGLSVDRILALPIPVPLRDEQHAIANFLDRETANIDAMIAKIEIAIERLQEYRTALITAAVTGKIDVRKLVTAEGAPHETASLS